MRSFRAKPVGWRGESHRHYLAAKGISSTYYSKKGKLMHKLDFKQVRGKSWVEEATDSKGRIVRKYPDEFKDKQATNKFSRVLKLEKKFPAVVKKISVDVATKNGGELQNAQAAYVIAKTGLRPGTEKDTKADVHAFGVTTLEDRHVKGSGRHVRLVFTGKKGVKIDKKIEDAKVAKILLQRKRAPGKQLFTEVNEGSLLKYVQSRGIKKTKDLRTVRANILAKQYKKQGLENKEIVQRVADDLGNTPAVAKGSYINPKVLT